jgi:pilus assembly protein Flp/PilA
MRDMLLKLYVNFENLARSEQGQDLVEYALLLAVAALAMISGIRGVATTVNTVFSNVSSSLS